MMATTITMALVMTRLANVQNGIDTVREQLNLAQTDI